MPSQSKNNGIKKPRGRPATGQGRQVMVRIQPDLLDLIDRMAQEQGLSTRPETIRFMLTEYLTSYGWIPLEPEEDELTSD